MTLLPPGVIVAVEALQDGHEGDSGTEGGCEEVVEDQRTGGQSIYACP